MDEIPGALRTVKTELLLKAPATSTSTLPVDTSPAVGIENTTAVLLQLVGRIPIPPNWIALPPWFAPKLFPLIVTLVPTTPEEGDKLVIVGPFEFTAKFSPALERPPTVTTTFPVVAPVGTLATICVADQLIGVAPVPLNVTALLPCVAPKFDPEIVTVAPIAPVFGERLVRVGVT